MGGFGDMGSGVALIRSGEASPSSSLIQLAAARISSAS
jgi:hypothetical protein